MLGISLCRLDIHGGDAALLHHGVGTVVHRLAVGSGPLSFFKEAFGAGFVDEVVVEKADRGQGAGDGVFLFIHFHPSFFHVLHVDAQSEGAVVDTYQLVIAKEAAAHGVNKFLVADGEKFPLSYRFDALHLGRGEGGLFLGNHIYRIVFIEPIECSAYHHGKEHNQDNSVFLHVGVLLF